MKKFILLSITLQVILSYSILAQYNPNSLVEAPFVLNNTSVVSPVFNDLLPTTRCFGTSSTDMTNSRLLKFFLGTPGTITNVGSPVPYIWCGAAMCGNPLKYYVIQMFPFSNYTLQTIDTNTGALTNLGNITGILPGHINPGVTGFTWDRTTNQAYITSSNLSQSQLYTLNLSTRIAVPVGSPTTIAPNIVAIAAALSGEIFAIDINTDNLYRFNKTNGTVTLIGSLGFNAEYAQTAEFDTRDGLLYWAAMSTALFPTSQLRTIDVATGNSTIVGSFPYATHITSLAMPVIPGPVIVHTPLVNTENLAGPYIVNCKIYGDSSPINPAMTKLFWSRNNTSITDSLLMTNSSGNNWTGNIPGNGTQATYRYFIKAVDMLNRAATHPAGAPGSLHTFTAGPDNIKPVITHIPIPNTPRYSWPVKVNAFVSDNSGVDSVWVKWFKNNTSTGIKHFKLNNTTGNIYSSPFNSNLSEIAWNDSIFYRIIAQDNSSNHNKDSTILHQFRITPGYLYQSCIGIDTTSVSYPFNTYWHDSKTQMLFTAAEISSNGGGMGGSIRKIGFYFTSVQAQVMNGFSIKMQHTTATSITSFVTTGWTTCYYGSYQVTGTGWRFIDMQTGFFYNSDYNLLVEICFDNTSYTLASNVLSSPTINMCREQHTDNAAGCSFTNGINVNRPNMCMEIELIIGISNNQSGIPNSFSLSQNYPNPFNPTTKIHFAIPAYQGGKGDGYVKLIVYDITGREVTTLVNEMKKPGYYEVELDGTNIASGVYFYVLEAGEFRESKKMLLIK